MCVAEVSLLSCIAEVSLLSCVAEVSLLSCVAEVSLLLCGVQLTSHSRSAMLHFYTPHISINVVDRAIKSFFVSHPVCTHDCL